MHSSLRVNYWVVWYDKEKWIFYILRKTPLLSLVYDLEKDSDSQEKATNPTLHPVSDLKSTIVIIVALIYVLVLLV